MKSINKSNVAMAIGSLMVSTASLTAVAADANPFQAMDLNSGYQQLPGEGQCGEGKCGEGQCGAKHSKKANEAKCGEGQCGGAA